MYVVGDSGVKYSLKYTIDEGEVLKAYNISNYPSILMNIQTFLHKTPVVIENLFW